MKPEQRQSYRDMIEAAANAQKSELSWVSNLYQKRLNQLQEQSQNYEQWLQSRNEHAWWRMRACLFDRGRIHCVRHSQFNASGRR